MVFDIWTDGGCSGNPGPGGWAFIITDTQGKPIYENKGGELGTTNNRMELLAVISALKYILEKNPDTDGVRVHTDSQYVKKGITEWINRWKINGWKSANKKLVKNMDLWLELDKLASRLPIEWKWVAGHAGIPLNERCDAMTRAAVTEILSRR